MIFWTHVTLTLVLSIFLTTGASVSNAEEITTSPKKTKKVQYRKTQEENFEGASVDGKSFNPTGSYLVQKRGINFVPLYNVKEDFDHSIQQSVEYLE